MAAPASTLKSLRKTKEGIRGDDQAAFNLNLDSVIGLVGGVIGIVILFALVANLLPTYADSVADVNENLTAPAVTFGDTTSDGIKPVFAILIGLGAVLAIVGAILAGFNKIS